MAPIYVPVPEPVTDERRLITRPWTMFCQLVIAAIDAAQGSIASLDARMTAAEAAIVALQSAVGTIQGQIVTILGWGVWQSYVATWNTSGVQPTLGATVVTGAYQQIDQTVNVRVEIVLGAGFAMGTGSHGVSLPVAPTLNNYGNFAAFAWDVGTANYSLTSLITTLNGNVCATFQTLASPMGVISATVPFTFVAGDRLTVFGTYQVP